MSKATVRFASICAGIVLMLGMTTTLSAQESGAPNKSDFIGLCKAMSPENHPLLPDEMRELAGKGAVACTETLDARIAVREKMETTAKKLATAIADKKSSAVDIIHWESEYLGAFVGLHGADRPMHEQNLQASLKYFDLLIAGQKAGTPFSDAVQSDYAKWQKVILAAENHAGLDKTLLAQSEEAQKVRMSAEDAEFKKAMRAFDELLRHDEAMKRLTDKDK